jgi:glycogen operon protein
MLVAGDEISRTQNGNNNPYCQDNEISWINWEKADKKLLDFTRKLIHLRKNHPVFCRRRWFKGQPIRGVGLEDIAWFLPDGKEMGEENWNHDFAKSLGVYLNGYGLRSSGPKGEKIIDDNFYIIFNAHSEPLSYKLPSERYGKEWIKILDTCEDFISEEGDEKYEMDEVIKVEGRSIILLKNNNHTKRPKK